MMDNDEIRARLIARREELETLRARSAESRAAVTLDQQSVGRLSRMDAMQAQAMAQASERMRAAEIARIGSALARLEDGTFGDCLRCGEPIAEKRLEADPSVTLCADCARQT